MSRIKKKRVKFVTVTPTSPDRRGWYLAVEFKPDKTGAMVAQMPKKEALVWAEQNAITILEDKE